MRKKWCAVWAVIGLLVSLVGSTAANEHSNPQSSRRTIDSTMTVDPAAIVTLCVASGTLKVRGWDKDEIHVRSLDAAQIDFKRVDKTKDPGKPAGRVDVMVFDRAGLATRLDCQAVASVEMDVPAGATVQVQTRDGDITIAGVAGAYAGSQNGDIMIDHAAKLVEAGSVGGSIYLKDSSGRVNLSSAGGVVEVVNVRPLDDEDTFEVGTVSGDIQLTRVSNPRVTAKTVNGTVTMTGPLAKAGLYSFQNTTGDVVLGMPHDASFRLSAKISQKPGIVSDFALKYLSDPPPPPPAKPARIVPRTGPVVTPIIVEKPAKQYILQRVNAICGTGDATISIASFGGTVRLKKI